MEFDFSVDMGQESPYPKVDQFIKENISRGSVQGYIRRCAYFKEGNGCGAEGRAYTSVCVCIAATKMNPAKSAVHLVLGNTITYDIGNNRWCANIGRPHKSNHIM